MVETQSPLTRSSGRRPSALRLAFLLLLISGPLCGLLFSLYEVARDGVGGVDGLDGISAVALSPTDHQVYAVSDGDHALAVFARSGSQDALSFEQVEFDGVHGVFGLRGASGVAASPDGRHVFVTAAVDDTLAVFARDASTDELIFLPAQVKENLVGSVVGLDGASSVAVAPDDSQVFVTGRIDDALAVFSRDATTDTLTFVEVELDGVGADYLGGASAVAVSPDSQHVYVAAYDDDAITQFTRNPGPGTLDYFLEVRDGVDLVDGIDGVTSIAISPDGRHLYATGKVDSAVAVFERDTSNGILKYRTSYRDGQGGVAGIGGASSVLVNDAGNRVLVAGRHSDSVALFRRSPDTGELLFLDLFVDGEDGADGLEGVLSLALTADGIDLFGAGHDEDALTRLQVAACIGNPIFGDTDDDAICDDFDSCFGDDFLGDDDGDNYCNDLDTCPGFDDGLDGDGDTIPDDCDFCFGDNSTGDSDSDAVCDDLDQCLGDDASGDGDGDLICDDIDACFGDNSTGDSDGDMVCDDLDVCFGDDATGDDDGDAVCNDLDVCFGDDATGDDDGDAVCNDLDICLGDDATGDPDGDGVCSDLDICLGDDATGDGDGDGICADLDCDDGDATNACAIFDDGFESGDTSLWN